MRDSVRNSIRVSAKSEPQRSSACHGAEPNTYALYLRRAEAARLLSVSLGTLDAWLKKRVIPHVRVGGRVVLVKTSDIHVALNRFRVKAVGE